MLKKLNIYMHISENSGVGYYRQYLPAVALRDAGLANVYINDFNFGEGNHHEPTIGQLFDLLVSLDIDLIVVGRRDDSKYYAQWGGIKEFFNIPIIVDTDDNVRFVRPWNPGYEGYYPGSEAITWNQYGISKVFDALTVSTEDLKEFHKKENPKIYVLPNNVDLKNWNKYPFIKKYDLYPSVKKDDDFIRVGFIGSAAHTESIQIIKKPIREIMKKYPKVKFVITHIFRNTFEDFEPELKNRIEFVGWFKLENWLEDLKKTGIDIGLAPLADNMFNRGKSNLRWLEYSSAGIPTIASDIFPYRCIKNRKNGIIVKELYEWYNAIEKLILRPEFRENLALEAYKTISQEYDIDKNIKLWYNVYSEVHDKYHEFFGEKKHFLKIEEGKDKGKYKLLN